MNEFLIELLENCEGVSNVKIICKDGILFSHKIIVANSSNFIRSIFLSIPFGDDITLFLPEFKKKTVEKFLLTEKEDTVEDIFVGQNPTVLKFLKCEEEEEEEEDDDDNLFEVFKTEEKHNEHEEFLMNLKEENESFAQIKITPTTSSPKKELSKKPLSTPKKTDDRQIRALKDNIQLSLSCEDLEKELIPNPTTSKEKMINKNILKKIACEKALAYFKSDDSVSYRAAAKKFGISHSTLMGIIKHGKQFKGPGRRSSKFLTEEEEKIIVDRALEVVRNGQQLDSSIVKKLIHEEIEIIKINFPERLLIDKQAFANFSYSFIKKHSLNKYFPEDVKVRHWRCDVCFKAFTMKNAMVHHQKKIHYSFLHQ